MNEIDEITFINFNGIEQYARVMYNDVKDSDKYRIEVAYNGKDIKALLEYLFKLEEESNKQKEVLDKIRKNNERIIDYGFDYDGFNNVEDLKKLIDMLVDYAKQNNELLEEIE